jgi:hypothetical protein
MGKAQWSARAAACAEAAAHLERSWTDDREKYEQGLVLAEKLRADAEKFTRIAAQSTSISQPLDKSLT